MRLSFISKKLSEHKNINRIFFYSIHGTNGDIFASMPFVNDIANKKKHLSIEYAFNSHLNKNFKYAFVDNVKTHNIFPPADIIKNNEFFRVIGDTIFVNTWFGSLPSFKSSKNNTLVQSPYGYYIDFKVIYDYLKIQLEKDIEFYIPTWLWNSNISDYSILDKELNHIVQKKVLLCNGIGYTNPNQYPGNSINNLLEYLFNKKYFVIVTNPDLLVDPIINEMYFSQLKIYLSNDIFYNTNPFYINEVYAKNCDIIIGSASGLFLSLMTTNTFEKYFIMYSNDGKFFVHERFNLNYITEYNENTFVTKIDSLLLSK